MLNLEKLDHKNPDKFLDCYFDQIDYLCVWGGQKFVSSIHLADGSWSLPQNCEVGCLYVDAGRQCVGIDRLDALYEIVEDPQ